MHLVRSGALMGYETLVSKMGHNPIKLLEQVSFSSAQVREPNTFISYVKLADLLDITSKACGDPYFGLRLASTQTGVVMGELAMSISQQATISDSFKYANQHLHIHAEGAHLDQVQQGEFVQWRFHLDFNNEWDLLQLLQMSLGQISNGGAMPASKDRRFSMHLQQKKPPGNSPNVDCYEPFLVFDSEFNGIQFPVSWLSRKFEYDPAVIKQYFHERVLMLENVYSSELQDRLKYLLTSALASGEYTINRMADSLDLHPRVLQKRLKEEGTTFSRLLQETRQSVACQNLQCGNITITDLALELGYAEVATFSRNFRRWTGLTPRQWRQQSRVRLGQ